MSNEQPKSKPPRVSLNPQTEIMTTATEGEDTCGGKKLNADPPTAKENGTDSAAMLSSMMSTLLTDLQTVSSNLVSATAALAPEDAGRELGSSTQC